MRLDKSNPTLTTIEMVVVETLLKLSSCLPKFSILVVVVHVVEDDTTVGCSEELILEVCPKTELGSINTNAIAKQTRAIKIHSSH